MEFQRLLRTQSTPGKKISSMSYSEHITDKTNCCCIFGRSRAAGSGRPAGQSRHPTSRPRGRLPGRAPPGPGCPGTPRDSPRYPGIARDSPGYSGIARDNPRPERGRGTVRERPLASAAARPGRGPRRDVPSGVTRCSSFASEWFHHSSQVQGMF